jgi:acyl dehydratase
MEPPAAYRVVAHNTATTSSNKIHDDAVARRYGFAGGLVPGVDVYAYMVHVPAAAWGTAWLERGTLRARFVQPVYEGDDVEVVPGEPSASGEGPGGAIVVPLEVRTATGTCAVGEAGLPAEAPPPPSAGDWGPGASSPGPEGDERPEASPESLRPGTRLVLAPHVFRADRAGDYLAEIAETLPLFAARRVAHPGWLVRDANRVLSANLGLGPWIHVESVTRHHGTVGDGESVGARATVVREWEQRGHRFVHLDVGLFAGGDRPVARVAHTAIYRPRRIAG